MRCAIGRYSRRLVNSILDQDDQASVIVAAERGADAVREERLEVVPCYRRADDYTDAVFCVVRDAGAAVVHFQHAPDLLGEDGRLPRLCRRLREAGVGTVVTLHTVYGPRRWRLFLGRAPTAYFHRALGAAADRLIVHHRDGCVVPLAAQGLDAARIAVIPHGTHRHQQDRDVSMARARLGLPQDDVVLTFVGSIWWGKNVGTIVSAFVRVAAAWPRARLLVAGEAWGRRWYNRLLVRSLRARIAAHRLEDRVTWIDEYLSDERAQDVISASDVVLLPHAQRYGSASGVFHDAIGAGRAVVCSRGPKFEDAIRVLADLPEALVPPRDISAWATAMGRMVSDPGLRERVRRAVSDYGAATSWGEVARMHLGLYRALGGRESAPAQRAAGGA